MDKVSQIVPDGIDSKYFEVKYRPGISNASLDVKCNLLLNYLALADVSRRQKEISLLYEFFITVLAKCNSEEELNNLTKFMEETAKIGGYATTFASDVAKYINVGGRNAAVKFVAIRKEQKEKQKNSRLEEWKQRYSMACNEFTSIMERSMKDDEEVSALISKFNALQGELYTFDGTVAKEFIAEMDWDIEQKIDYLKELYLAIEKATKWDL